MRDKVILEKIESNAKKKPSVKNALIAFVSGGIMALIAQGLHDLYLQLFDIAQDQATSYVIVTLILLSCILTGLNLYHKIAQIAGAGLFIPITGFANALTSCALDGKKEGLILGIGCNMFKLAGAVLTYGIVSATFFGLIRFLFFS